MQAFLALLAGKGLLLAGGLGSGLALGLAAKFIPGLIAKYTGQELLTLLNPSTSDPAEAKLIHDVVLALVKLAEYKIPDSGSSAGAEKYKLVADRLVSLVPILKGQEDRVKALIEAAVTAMDQELKKAS